MSKLKTMPPGPKESPVFGSTKHFLTDMPFFLLKLARDYGSLASFHLGRTPVVLVNEPDWIEHILVNDGRKFIKSRAFKRLKVLLGEGTFTSEGDFHLRQRRLCQKAFHKNRFSGYQKWMKEYSKEMVETFRPGETRDIQTDMMRLTLRVVGKAVFDKDLQQDAPSVGDALTEFLEYFPIRMVPGSELLDNVPVSSTRHIDHAKKELDRVIYSIIEERRKDSKDHGDLLSMLMKAVDHEGDGTGMTDEQLRDEAMTIFLAGHETTANALSWTFYCLSLNPEVRKKMFHEVDTVLEGRLPTDEDYPNLPYTKMVFAEAMRMYPPVWLIGRECLEEYPLGDYKIPAGAFLYVSPLVTQNDPRFWDEPLAFRPERHTKEATKARPKYAYFPFSGGQRLCMGERFAWMEGVTILATISQKYELRYQQNRPSNYSANLTLRPKRGMPMEVVPRFSS